MSRRVQDAFSGAFADRPAAGVLGQIYLPTDTPWVTHCWDDGLAWHNFYNGLELTAPPTASWSWISQGGATRTDEKASILVASNDAAATPGNKRLIYRALPAAPYTLTLGFCQPPLVASTNNQTKSLDAGLYDSASGKTVLMGMSATSGGTVYGVYNVNSNGTFNDFSFGSANTAIAPPPVFFLQIQDDGTTRYWRLSFDGVTFYLLGSTTRTSFITPDSFMFGCHDYLSVARLVHYAAQ